MKRHLPVYRRYAMGGKPTTSIESIESPREVTAKLAYVALLYALPVFILFSILGKWEEGIGAWVCTTIVLMVVQVRWDLRRYFWFWITIGFALFFQAPFVVLVPWNDRNVTWITVLPVGVWDYFLVYGCIKLAEKLMLRSSERIKS